MDNMKFNHYQEHVINCDEHIVLVDGSIGNGKTVSAIARIHKLMAKNPDSTAIFVGKTYLSNLMDYYRDTVYNMGYGVVPKRSSHSVEYPNGSTVKFTNLNRGYNELRSLIGNNCKIVCIDNLDNFEVDIMKHLPFEMASIQFLFTVVPPFEGAKHWIYKRLIKTGIAYRVSWTLLDTDWHEKDYIEAVKNVSRRKFRDNLFMGVWFGKDEEEVDEFMVTWEDTNGV